MSLLYICRAFLAFTKHTGQKKTWNTRHQEADSDNCCLHLWRSGRVPFALRQAEALQHKPEKDVAQARKKECSLALREIQSLSMSAKVRRGSERCIALLVGLFFTNLDTSYKFGTAPALYRPRQPPDRENRKIGKKYILSQDIFRWGGGSST